MGKGSLKWLCMIIGGGERVDLVVTSANIFFLQISQGEGGWEGGLNSCCHNIRRGG